MGKQQISTLQLGMLMFPTIMITAVLLVPSITTEIADRDMWISTIIGSVSGIVAVFLAWKLHQQFKGKTIIQYSSEIVGSIPGKIIGVVYIIYYLHNNSLVLIQYAHFMVGYFLNDTPIIAIIVLLVITCALSVRSGVEVMGRSSQFFTPLIFIFIIIIFLLLSKDLDYKHMLPVMGNGLLPVLKGASTPIAWFSHFFAISFFLPYLSSKSNGLKSGLFIVLAVITALTMTNLFSLLLFGESTSTYTYPVWSATRYISVGGFLEHVEALIMVVWLAGVFIKVSVFYYITVIGTAQWFELKDYRPIVFPIGFILVVVSMWSFPTLQELRTFTMTTLSYYLPSVEIVLPTILLLIMLIKNRWKHQQGGDSRAKR